MPAAIHGGSHEPDVLDFSTGISPLAPPDDLLAAIRGADLSRYPPATAWPACKAIGALHELPTDRIVVGAGSVELIWALARAFGGPGRTGLVVVPAFAEYEQALRASGAAVVPVAMQAPEFAFPLDAVDRVLAKTSICIAFVCRPSNPCLTIAPADGLIALAQRWPRTLFVVDEAYLPMFEGVEGTGLAANVAVLRSLTKIFALPGLRLGYLLADGPVAAAVQATLPPWNVSSPAQAAAVSGAQLLPVHAGAIRARICFLRASLAEDLVRVAGPPARGGGPFLLYDVGDAAALAGHLRDQRVIVRSGVSFGLPRHIRVGTRLEQENLVLVERWTEIRDGERARFSEQARAVEARGRDR